MRYIKRGLEPPAYTPRPACIGKIAAFEAYLRERVAAYPELTASRLHRELRDLGFAGGYTTVKVFLRTIPPGAFAGFEVRFETPPGRQAQVDFAHFRTVFTDEPGIDRVVWLFSMVLGHSRMLWGRFVPQQDMQTVLRCHAAAFEALGGAPAEILYDRMRTVVDREVLRGGPEDGPQAGHIVYNRTLVEFARYYGYLPKACKAYRAKTKVKVERPFRYIREDFFLGRSFRNRDDLNIQFRQWLDQVANARVHATTHRVVSEHFAEELPRLQPLPPCPFQAVLCQSALNKQEPVTRRTVRDQPQRVRAALDGLQASGRADGAQLAAAACWTRDYELGVHLARDPESVGTGSGSPDGVSVAACDALSRHRETSVSLGRAGTELMIQVGHRGLSLSAVARWLTPTMTGNNVNAATKSILAALDTLIEHYEHIDSRSSRQRAPWAERIATYLRAVPGPKRVPMEYAA